MQLTAFDRWLKEKFCIETHVQVLRMPEEVPRGVKVVELPDVPGRRFQFLFVCKKTKTANELFAVLRDESMMYNTQIVVKDKWYVKFIAPEEKSVTWSLISWTIVACIIAGVAYGCWRLWQNPEIRQNLIEALDILKG